MFTLTTLAGQFLFAGLSGLFAGVVALLVGGLGGILALKRRVTALESNQEDIAQRLVSEVKKRGGYRSAEQRKENLEEAADIAARAQAQPPQGRGVRIYGRVNEGA